MINITRHITDRQNIITPRFSIIMLCFSIITLSLLNITFLTGTIVGIPISTTSALSYQSSTDVSFNFNPILSISVSPDSITIPTIAPGTTATSNTITVNVSTNTAYGYSLLASVGNSTSYNTSDLIHGDSTMDFTFTSIATNASLPQLDTDNTWGYSTSLDNGSTWSTYHGLPLYSTVGNNTSTNNPALLIDTTSPADSKSIDFRIAARSSPTQPSGTYSNVINFYAVGKPSPLYMQETNIIKSQLKNIGDKIQAVDNRDGKTYWIAKQADGNIWMVQNLDLCLGCEGTATLTSRNTDLNESGNGAYVNGYSNDGRKIIWSPAETATTLNMGSSNSIEGWRDNEYVPYSVHSQLCVTPFGDNDHTRSCMSTDGKSHLYYLLGTYYNWSAAVASNYSASLTSHNSIASNSICPFGWRLPIVQSDSTATASNYEFGQLLYSSNITTGLTDMSYTANGFYGIRNNPLFLVRGGGIEYSSGSMVGALRYAGSAGYYWSSVVYWQYGGSVTANGIAFGKDAANLEAHFRRSMGESVRCLVRQ